MKTLAEIYRGKAKTLYQTEDPNLLVVEFRDDTSAFDGVKMDQLADKGKINNVFNAFIMEQLAAQGVVNHFVKRIDDTHSVVKHLQMIPVECVVRNRAAGSLCKRLGIEEGRILAPATFEFFLKNDALHDPMINESHILTFGWADEAAITTMKAITLKANDILSALFDRAGLILVDYKLEFGYADGELMLGDEFSPDGCRIWDKQTLEKLDKDRYRRDLGNVVEAYTEVAQRLGILS